MRHVSRDISPNSRASLHLPSIVLLSRRQIPIPTLISPAMDGFLTTLASAAQIWPAGLYRESTCVSPRGRLNRRRTLGVYVYGAIEPRVVVYIGHYGTGVYDCNRLHYGGDCMYAAPWFRGTVWGVNEAPATHMAPPVTRVTSAPRHNSLWLPVGGLPQKFSSFHNFGSVGVIIPGFFCS